MLALFFENDRMNFSVTTNNVGPTIQDARTFTRFSDAAQEVVDGRIYEGIDFRFADEAARKQGTQVANWAFKHYMRPLNQQDNNDDQRSNPRVVSKVLIHQ
jgi:hypothetical protein